MIIIHQFKLNRNSIIQWYFFIQANNEWTKLNDKTNDKFCKFNWELKTKIEKNNFAGMRKVFIY